MWKARQTFWINFREDFLYGNLFLASWWNWIPLGINLINAKILRNINLCPIWLRSSRCRPTEQQIWVSFWSSTLFKYLIQKLNLAKTVNEKVSHNQSLRLSNINRGIRGSELRNTKSQLARESFFNYVQPCVSSLHNHSTEYFICSLKIS